MKIVLATDGSEFSEGAARFLAALDLLPDDEIVVIHAISSVHFQDNRKSYEAAIRRFKEEAGAKILESAATVLRNCNAKISTALVDGYPEKAIPDAASERHADLVVMGSRGLRGIKSLVVGSVPRSVAIGSPKPILVVKPAQWAKAEGLKILLATDGSDHAGATARLLASIPFRRSAELTVINVTPSSFADIPARFAIEVDAKVKKEVAEARAAEFDDSERILGLALSNLSGRFANAGEMKKVGDPATEILEAAAALDADIIAMGSRGLRGIKGTLGSVSRHILNHAECSVLIGKT
jgi:nucleotide-binding universal stress UspA family protein